MEELERLKARLENIRAVEPILGALRTISLGSRLLALNKGRSVEQYSQHLLRILALITPYLRQYSSTQRQERQPGESIALLVIGSERGLCGAFNDTVVSYAEQILAQYSVGVKVRLMTLGSRTQRALRYRERVPVWAKPLSVTALPPYELAVELVSEWLRGYEQYKLDAVEVVYNAPRGLMRYEPTIVRLLPPTIPPVPAEESQFLPIIETEPLGLYIRLVQLWLTARLYQILLESAVAEHTARYQLLDGATQNAERLMEELKLSLQVARQEAITAEMLDLISGAGLIGPRPT
jgi:F-type H+-transporting ATPase subunit gamma